MPFTSVALTGTVETSPGTPAPNAIVTLTLSNEISDGSSVIEPVPNVVQTASNGTFSITVPANDDSSSVPSGTWYSVVIRTNNGQVVDTFQVVVPHADAPTVDLFSLARLAAAPAAATPYVVSLNGQSGIVTLPAPVVFTGSGTWTPSGSATATYRATVVGGGGGGNPGASYGGGGGGGGGEVLDVYLGSVTAAQAVTIGAGGASGASGTSTTIGALATARPGNNGYQQYGGIGGLGNGGNGLALGGGATGGTGTASSGGTGLNRFGSGGGGGAGLNNPGGWGGGPQGQVGGAGVTNAGGGGSAGDAGTAGSAGSGTAGGAGGHGAANTGSGGGGGGQGSVTYGVGGQGGSGYVVIYQLTP